MVKNPPAKQEMCLIPRSEKPLEEEMATHSSILFLSFFQYLFIWLHQVSVVALRVFVVWLKGVSLVLVGGLSCPAACGI